MVLVSVGTLTETKIFKAELSLSGFWSKRSLDNREFCGGFFPACFFHVEKNPQKIHQKPTAKTKHQNPRLFSGKGCVSMKEFPPAVLCFSDMCSEILGFLICFLLDLPPCSSGFEGTHQKGCHSFLAMRVLLP